MQQTLSSDNVKAIVIERLRSNPDKWHTMGIIVLHFNTPTGNEKQIMRVRVHRALCRLNQLGLIERRELENYEYKWIVK